MQTTLSHVDDDDDDHTASKSSPVVVERRRRAGRLKAMRQCQSLPHASSQSTLRMLIESRVHLPTWSRDATERRGRRRDDHFLLDVVRDVSCELDLTRDSRSPARPRDVIAHLPPPAAAAAAGPDQTRPQDARQPGGAGLRAVGQRLHDARRGVEHLVVSRPSHVTRLCARTVMSTLLSWSAGGRGRLTVRSYDARDGLSDHDRYTQTTHDASTLTSPWGHEVTAYRGHGGVKGRPGVTGWSATSLRRASSSVSSPNKRRSLSLISHFYTVNQKTTHYTPVRNFAKC